MNAIDENPLLSSATVVNTRSSFETRCNGAPPDDGLPMTRPLGFFPLKYGKREGVTL
jgi:hypothetical protein